VKQFKGTIANKKLSDFNQYDNSLTKYDDRANFVESFLYEDGFVHDFFAVYFRDYYTVSPSQDGFLAEEDAVCKLIDILGTYLLSANDVQSNRKIEYKFWKSEREYRDYKDSNNVSAITTDENGREVEVVDMFVDKKSKNQKIVRPISINSKDLKNISEIRALEDAIDYMKSPKGTKAMKEKALELLEAGVGTNDDQDRLKYIAKNTERYIARYVKSLREDQILIKKAITRPLDFKAVLKGEGVPHKLDALDFMEVNDVTVLLPYLYQEDIMTELGTIVYDLNVLINNTKLSSREQEIVGMLRNEYKQIEIAEALDIRKQNVKTYMKRIAEKVVKTYEKQVESYRNEIRQKKVK
jgi:DNA-binding CsgD family transcriptional regulator